LRGVYSLMMVLVPPGPAHLNPGSSIKRMPETRKKTFRTGLHTAKLRLGGHGITRSATFAVVHAVHDDGGGSVHPTASAPRAAWLCEWRSARCVFGRPVTGVDGNALDRCRPAGRRQPADSAKGLARVCQSAPRSNRQAQRTRAMDRPSGVSEANGLGPVRASCVGDMPRPM